LGDDALDEHQFAKVSRSLRADLRTIVVISSRPSSAWRWRRRAT